MDLAQDVFVKAYSSLDTFRSDSKFTTWLYIIARNRWRDSLRARQSRPLEVPVAAMLDQEPATGNDALATIEASDARAVVRRLMDEALNETEKRVMTLHYGHGMQLAAITAALGLTNASGAKAYIVSARRKLNIAITRWKNKPDQSAAARPGLPVDRSSALCGRQPHARRTAPRVAYRQVRELPGGTRAPVRLQSTVRNDEAAAVRWGVEQLQRREPERSSSGATRTDSSFVDVVRAESAGLRWLRFCWRSVGGYYLTTPAVPSFRPRSVLGRTRRAR